MSYGMVTLQDGSRRLMHHDVLHYGSPAFRNIGELIHWSSDGYVAPSRVMAIVKLADVSYKRCDNGQTAYMSVWGYELEVVTCQK